MGLLSVRALTRRRGCHREAGSVSALPDVYCLRPFWASTCVYRLPLFISASALASASALTGNSLTPEAEFLID